MPWRRKPHGLSTVDVTAVYNSHGIGQFAGQPGLARYGGAECTQKRKSAGKRERERGVGGEVGSESRRV